MNLPSESTFIDVHGNTKSRQDSGSINMGIGEIK